MLSKDEIDSIMQRLMKGYRELLNDISSEYKISDTEMITLMSCYVIDILGTVLLVSEEVIKLDKDFQKTLFFHIYENSLKNANLKRELFEKRGKDGK